MDGCSEYCALPTIKVLYCDHQSFKPSSFSSNTKTKKIIPNVPLCFTTVNYFFLAKLTIT